MADLTELQSAGTTKVVGSSSTGLETNPVDASTNRELFVRKTLKGTGTEGALTVGTSAVEVKVGVSRLSNRQSVTLFNNSSVTLYWGFSSGVTTSTGTPIFKSQLFEWDADDSCSIYVIAGSAGNNARITECP